MFIDHECNMGFAETFHYYFTECADKRVIHWPLLRTPYTIPVIVFSYLYFVLRCGPRYMKNKPPYSLKTFIRIYDVFQIIANATIIYIITDYGKFTELTLKCSSVKYTLEPSVMKIVTGMWYLLWLKLIDLVETVIFVLKKNQHQISFLHLYHHVSTLLIGWIFIRYIASPATAVAPILNSCVHVIMYTYYFLSTFKNMQSTLYKFKPIVTLIQLVQFVILLLHSVQGLMPSCKGLPKHLILGFMINLLVNFALFLDFYVKNYVKGKAKVN